MTNVPEAVVRVVGEWQAYGSPDSQAKAGQQVRTVVAWAAWQ
jgi:hypothetical protein